MWKINWDQKEILFGAFPGYHLFQSIKVLESVRRKRRDLRPKRFSRGFSHSNGFKKGLRAHIVDTARWWFSLSLCEWSLLLFRFGWKEYQPAQFASSSLSRDISGSLLPCRIWIWHLDWSYVLPISTSIKSHATGHNGQYSFSGSQDNTTARIWLP